MCAFSCCYPCTTRCVKVLVAFGVPAEVFEPVYLDNLVRHSISERQGVATHAVSRRPIRTSPRPLSSSLRSLFDFPGLSLSLGLSSLRRNGDRNAVGIRDSRLLFHRMFCQPAILDTPEPLAYFAAHTGNSFFHSVFHILLSTKPTQFQRCIGHKSDNYLANLRLVYNKGRIRAPRACVICADGLDLIKR